MNVKNTFFGYHSLKEILANTREALVKELSKDERLKKVDTYLDEIDFWTYGFDVRGSEWVAQDEIEHFVYRYKFTDTGFEFVQKVYDYEKITDTRVG